MDYSKNLEKHIFDTIASTKQRMYYAGQLLLFNVEVMRSKRGDVDSKQTAQTSINEYKKCIHRLKELHTAYSCMKERNQTQLSIPCGFRDGKQRKGSR